jgi:hypothetical protein
VLILGLSLISRFSGYWDYAHPEGVSAVRAQGIGRKSASRIYFWSFALQNSTLGSTFTPERGATAQGIEGV